MVYIQYIRNALNYNNLLMKTKLLFLLFLVSLSTYAQNPNIPILENGLLAYYPSTANANNDDPNGYNGILTGVSLTADRFGNANKAYSFSGVASYVDAVIATIPQNNTPRTIASWLNTNTPNNNENRETCFFDYGSLLQAQIFSLFRKLVK